MKNLNKDLKLIILTIIGVITGKVWVELTSNTGMSLFLQVITYAILVIFITVFIIHLRKIFKNK